MPSSAGSVCWKQSQPGEHDGLPSKGRTYDDERNTVDDFYDLLGVDPATDAQHLRRAWRDLVWQHHPDRVGAHATPTYEKMSQAYAVLSDPAARAAYDRWRASNPKPAATIPPPPVPPRSAPWDGASAFGLAAGHG